MLYKKVMEDLKSRINSSEFSVGDVLPTEKSLMEHYSYSRITIRRAIDELVSIGLLEKKQGFGTVIVDKQMTGDLFILRSTLEYTTAVNKTVFYKVVCFNLTNPPEKIRELLDLNQDEKVYYIRRLKTIDGEASIVEDSYMPISLFPELNIKILEQSKYNYIDHETDYVIEGASQEFLAEIPDAEVYRLLDIDPSNPLLKIESLGNFEDGRLFEFTEIWHKPDSFSFKHYLKR